VDDNGVKDTDFVFTEKVVPAKQAQGVGGASPSVNEKQQEVFYKKGWGRRNQP
jgi:hypothetical protein